MFGVILTSHASPTSHRRPILDRLILFPHGETMGPDDLEVPSAGSPPDRPATGGPLPALRIFEPESRTARTRRILGMELTFVAHPSFDDPSVHEAILGPAPEGVAVEPPDRTSRAAYRVSYLAGSRGAAVLSREQEAHLFRKMNYLKYLASRIRDRVDPNRPRAADLDEIERLHVEAVELKNQIVEANLRLVISVVKKRLRAGVYLSDRVSDGNFALLLAVDRFDFARGNRFSTYATWAIINEIVRSDRKEQRRHKRSDPAVPRRLSRRPNPRAGSTSNMRPSTSAEQRSSGSSDGWTGASARSSRTATGSAASPSSRSARLAGAWGSARNASARSSNALTRSSASSPVSSRSSRRSCDAGHESERAWDSRPRLAVGSEPFLHEDTAMRLMVLGVDHRSAPTSVRENLAFPGECHGRGLSALQASFPGTEFVAAVDLQPGRGLRGRRVGTAGSPRAVILPGPVPRDAGRERERAPGRAPRGVRDRPSLPRHGRPGEPGARRGPDPRPGPRGLQGRRQPGNHRADPPYRLPESLARRQASP